MPQEHTNSLQELSPAGIRSAIDSTGAPIEGGSLLYRP